MPLAELEGEGGIKGGREGSPCRDDEDVLIGHLVGAIDSLREDEAIGLAVPEGGREGGGVREPSRKMREICG